jgi:hypothetical protein
MIPSGVGDPDNDDHWTVFFTERRNTELAHYEGTNPPSANKNAAARKVWWGVRAAPSPGSSTTSPQATTRG